MAIAPFARFELTIIGSISGVRPTATARANNDASTQSPLLKPLISSTIGTITSIKRISSQLTLFTPRSNAVWVRVPTMDFASEPNQVRFPVATTTACALPLVTLVPIRQILPISSRLLSLFGSGSLSHPLPDTLARTSYFSTGSDSPLSIDWLTNRSRDSSRRTSAGTRSPAARKMMSPGTSSSMAISSCAGPMLPGPRRSTVAVVRTMDFSACAALLVRNSCQKRNNPLRLTIVTIMIIPVRSVSSPLRSGSQ